ncbi:MAG: MFS transporter [Clostridia bacterium]|nr:MFS transporter [Clostridia bacterium]
MKKMPDPEKASREIARREKQLAGPRGKFYFPYLIFIVSLVYITDEIASMIGTLMKTEIANDMLSHFGDSSVGMLDILSVISVPFLALGMLYKPLSDRFGRKPFLVINTVGMSLGLLIIYLSKSIPAYVLGACVIQFFVPHDMQAVYILEASPARHRAKLYSAVKCVAMLVVMAVPVLRRYLMPDTSQWRRVYLIPAVVGLVTSLAAMLFAKETDAFNRSRINYLRGNTQENGTDASGGVIPALKFVWKHKQLRWLYIAVAFAESGYLLTVDYQVVISYGYAEHFLSKGLFPDLASALESVGVNEVTAALFLFPVGCALGHLLPGFVADRKSRKAAALFSSLAAVVFFLGFMIGSRAGWPPYLVGFFSGACIGFFWSNVDTINMMTGESSPTALRSSILATVSVATGVGVAVSYAITIPLLTKLGNASTGPVLLCVAVPSLIAAFAILAVKTHDTRGVDLTAVRGDEWDEPTEGSAGPVEPA